jgi:hypothetical protein
MAPLTSLLCRRMCEETIRESRNASVAAMYGHAV